MREHTSFSDPYAHGRTDGHKCICYLNKVAYKNDNCVGLKQAKNTFRMYDWAESELLQLISLPLIDIKSKKI